MVVEYMMHLIKPNIKAVPIFIKKPGHWFNPSNNTYVGWVDDNRDYYVPDTIVTLTKEQFMNRALQIHANDPIREQPTEPVLDPSTIRILSEEEVKEQANNWYDFYSSENNML